MKKCGKTALSLLLSVSMGVATVTPVMASPARGEPELNPLVAVIEKVNSGDTLNLTELQAAASDIRSKPAGSYLLLP